MTLFDVVAAAQRVAQPAPRLGAPRPDLGSRGGEGAAEAHAPQRLRERGGELVVVEKRAAVQPRADPLDVREEGVVPERMAPARAIRDDEAALQRRRVGGRAARRRLPRRVVDGLRVPRGALARAASRCAIDLPRWIASLEPLARPSTNCWLWLYVL